MEEINEVLAEFSHLIHSKTVSKDEKRLNGYYYKVIVVFKKGSKLVIHERLSRLGYQYSYHWMDEENKLIIRWDNAPHHLDIALNHKHIGTKENIEASQEMTLKKVLDFIAKIIGFFVGLGLIFWAFS